MRSPGGLLPWPRPRWRHLFASLSTAANSKVLAAPRGMRDVLPAECAYRAAVAADFRCVVARHGFVEIETPLLEKTAVFARTLGDESDVVAKEMYTFTPPTRTTAGGRSTRAHAALDSDSGVVSSDRDGSTAESLTLRPEGTAGVMRAAISGGLLNCSSSSSQSAPPSSTSAPLRLFYDGPMFRHERPQRGRYRQFRQLGVEMIGGSGHPHEDVDAISVAYELLQHVIQRDAHRVTLLLNSLGDASSLASYRDALARHFETHRASLSADSEARRVRGAYLRILDSKNPQDVAAVAAAPPMLDFLTLDAAARFAAVRAGLDALGIAYEVSPRLVRGLDYYCHTVFEFVVTPRVGGGGDVGGDADAGGGGPLGTVLAGGRYDGLCAALGGPNGVGGIGWAAGLERLVLLSSAAAPDVQLQPWAAVLAVSPDATQGAADSTNSLVVAQAIRDSGASCVVLRGYKTVKKAVGAASRAGVRMAVIVGEDEVARGGVQLKDMATGAQTFVPLAGLSVRDAMVALRPHMPALVAAAHTTTRPGLVGYGVLPSHKARGHAATASLNGS